MLEPIVSPRPSWLSKRIASAPLQVTLIYCSFVGLSGSIFPILKSLKFSDNFAYISTSLTTLTLVLLLSAFFFSSWKIYLVRATIILLFAISLVLCGLLYWKYFVDVDDWVTWNERVSAKVDVCERKYKEEHPEEKSKEEKLRIYDAKASCIGKAVHEEKYPHQGQESKLKIASLENDIRAGSYLMKSPVIPEVLKTKLGVGEKFIGTGLAIPSGVGKVYSDARFPEYLVPNLRENEAEILTWKINSDLESKVSSQTIECLIIGCGNKISPSNIKFEVKEEKAKYDRIIGQIQNPKNRTSDEKIVLIRFNRFPEGDYKGTLGRPEASWVFMLRLRDVWTMSLNDALTYSGHNIEGSQSTNTIFVWIYISDNSSNSRIPATWLNMVDNIDKLLR